jgi:hypothetical protein
MWQTLQWKNISSIEETQYQIKIRNLATIVQYDEIIICYLLNTYIYYYNCKVYHTAQSLRLMQAED